MPEKNYIGVEVHRPGVGRLLNNASEAGLTNMRVFCTDALDVLAKSIPDGSLETVQLFFPDPWHKKSTTSAVLCSRRLLKQFVRSYA